MSQTIEVTLDAEGHILIPASLRNQLGLKAGTTLVVETDEQGDALLRVQSTEPHLVEENGILVVAGVPAWDIENALEQDREERYRHILGLDSE